MISLWPRFAVRTTAHFAVAIVLAGILVPGASLAQQCPLTAPLTIEDTQDGFAGQTGTVWTIASDCSFVVAQQIGPRSDPIKQGRLTAGQQARLGEQLARSAVADIPEQLGNASPPVNARRIALSYGGKRSVFTLPAGGGGLNDLRASTRDPSAGRLLDLAETVKDITGS
jgi:hypothetical protein